MQPGGSERLTNRQSDRSTSTSGAPERVAQVRTHRTAPLDQPAADPSSLPASRLRDRMNQRTPRPSTGEFFNKIRQKQPFPRCQQFQGGTRSPFPDRRPLNSRRVLL